MSGRAAPGRAPVRCPARCRAFNGSHNQEKQSADILRNGGSAAPNHAPPPPPAAPPIPFSQDVANNISYNKPAENNAAVQQAARNGGKNTQRSRDVLLRAREIMSVDPSAPSALNLIGSKVDMRVRFSIHYDTKLGEELYVIGSHQALGAWDQTNAVPMAWGEGGNWSAEVDLPAGG